MSKSKKKKDAPIGFGRKPMPDEAGDSSDEDEPQERAERQLPPPLVEPIAVDDVEMYEIFERYNLHPLIPPAKFEYQLVEIIAALEQRLRQLDPDL